MQSANNKNITAEFLIPLFNCLNTEKIKYCILRNYEDLPYKVSNDIDIWVDVNDRDSFYAIVKKLAYTLDYTLDYTPRLSLMGEGDYFLIKEKNNSLRTIHVDCWTHIHWKGISFVDESVIGNHLNYTEKGFYIPSRGITGCVSLLKEVLYNHSAKEKYKEMVKDAAQNDGAVFLQMMIKPFGVETSQQVLEMAKQGSWHEIEKLAGKLRRKLFWRSFLHPIDQINRWRYYFYAQYRRYFVNSRGVFIVLIGPDGSGKSTTANNLIDAEIRRLFQKKLYYHGHFPFLPELKKIMSFFRLNASHVESNSTVKSSETLSFSLVRSMIYPIYYGLNYFLGHLSIWKGKSQGNLIIFDRYFYDYFIQPLYNNVPRWLLYAIAKIIPRPDAVIYLKNEPEIIFSRKPELTIEEIKTQSKRCEDLTEQLKNSFTVTTVNAEFVVEEIQKIIIHKIMERRKLL